MNRMMKVAELAAECFGMMEQVATLQERIAEAKKEIKELVDAEETPTATMETTEETLPIEAAPSGKRRGRPPGSKNSITVVGKKKPVEKYLPRLLERIAKEQAKPLKLAAYVSLARNAGYVSSADDFPNMVYQSLLKLVRKRVLEKDQETRDYHYIGGKAA